MRRKQLMKGIIIISLLSLMLKGLIPIARDWGRSIVIGAGLCLANQEISGLQSGIEGCNATAKARMWEEIEAAKESRYKYYYCSEDEFVRSFSNMPAGEKILLMLRKTVVLMFFLWAIFAFIYNIYLYERAKRRRKRRRKKNVTFKNITFLKQVKIQKKKKA